MPNMILVTDSAVINLDHVLKLEILGAKDDAKNGDPALLNVDYTTGQHEQIETTYGLAWNALMMTQVCSGLIDPDDDDDDYTPADAEIDKYCMNCKHFVDDDPAYPTDPCDSCVHNLDEDCEPAGTDDNYAPDGEDD